MPRQISIQRIQIKFELFYSEFYSTQSPFGTPSEDGISCKFPVILSRDLFLVWQSDLSGGQRYSVQMMGHYRNKKTGARATVSTKGLFHTSPTAQPRNEGRQTL